MVKETANHAEETFHRLRHTTTGKKDQEELEIYMAQLRMPGIPENLIRKRVRSGILKYTYKVKEEH